MQDLKSIGRMPIPHKTWLRFKDMAYRKGMKMGDAAAQAILEWMERHGDDGRRDAENPRGRIEGEE